MKSIFQVLLMVSCTVLLLSACAPTVSVSASESSDLAALLASSSPLAQSTPGATIPATITPGVGGTLAPSTPTLEVSPTVTATAIVSTTPQADPKIAALIEAAVEKTGAVTAYHGFIKFQVGQALVENWDGDLNGPDARYTHFSDWYSEDVEITLKDGAYFRREYLGGAYGLWEKIPNPQAKDTFFQSPLNLLLQMMTDAPFYRKVQTIDIDDQQCDVYGQENSLAAASAVEKISTTLRFPLVHTEVSGVPQSESVLVLCPDGYLHAALMQLQPQQFDVAQIIVRVIPNSGIAITVPEIITPTPTLSPTPRPTDTPAIAPPQATATAQAVTQLLNERAKWTPVLTDWDEENLHDWSVGQTTGDITHTLTITGTTYRWEIQASRAFASSRSTTVIEPTNFYATMDIQRVSGSPEAEYGMVFGSAGDNDYEFYLTDELVTGGESYFSLYQSAKDKSNELFGYVETPFVKKGQMNRLGVLVEGKRITLFINEQMVGQVEVDEYMPGWFGVYSGMSDLGDAVLEFSNLVVRVPPSQVTPTPNAAQATPTALAAQNSKSAAMQWKVMAADDFSTNVNQWPLDDTTAEYGPATAQVVDGKYRWTIDPKRSVYYYELAPKFPTLGDFYATVDARLVRGPARHFYGMVVRVTGQQYYFFRIRNNRYVSVQRVTDRYTTLIPNTPTTAIKPDAVNKLAVLAQGSHLSFFVNDQFVGQVEDSILTQGQVGIVYGVDTPAPAAFEFDNFELRAP